MADDEELIPKPGQWPVNPQEDQPVSETRIWVDGCFDFTHHGHAGAILQAKKLGTELLVGIHSDEAILHNKGPTVMTLDERIQAVSSCRFANATIPYAPYNTSLPWVSHYGAKYVVHGDDITTDSSGLDTYRFVKAAGRFLVVKRTPGISTTDLVGRMLLFSKGHFIKDFVGCLEGREKADGGETGSEMLGRMGDYARDEFGKGMWVDVSASSGGEFRTLVEGKKPARGQRVVYADGSFDLFSSGHIEFLKQVTLLEEQRAESEGWYSQEKKEARISTAGYDYAPLYLVVGLHDDHTVNKEKGANYPIMNLYERSLCVLQCKYVHSVITNAPWTPTASYLRFLPYGAPVALYHGPTAIPSNPASTDGVAGDPYAAAKEMGIYNRIPKHKYSDVNAAQIVKRILKNREMYEERQRKKGWKAEKEKVLEEREKSGG